MKLSLSDYCKEKDRIKEELKWLEIELEELQNIFNPTQFDCNFGLEYEIKQIQTDIKELENEWDQLHGDKK